MSYIGYANDRRRIIRVILLERCASCLSSSYNLAHLSASYRVTCLMTNQAELEGRRSQRGRWERDKA